MFVDTHGFTILILILCVDDKESYLVDNNNWSVIILLIYIECYLATFKYVSWKKYCEIDLRSLCKLNPNCTPA